MTDSNPEEQGLGLIVAVARNGVIGHEGGMPWHLPGDLKHFKRTTLDHAIILGRATWESLPGVLPRRRHIVVTRNIDYAPEGAEVAHSLDAAIDLARTSDPHPWIAGGANLYAQALPLVTRIAWTEVHAEPEGDTWFPAWDRNPFVEAGREEHDGFTIFHYLRR